MRPRPASLRRVLFLVAALTTLVVSSLNLTSASAATYPNPGYVTGNVTGVHDPSMIKTAGGTYVLVSTGNWLEIRTSTDRIHFGKVGSVWSSGGATWTYPYTLASDRSYLWAPDISYHNGLYYLYYAASSFGSQHSAIFLATSPTAMPGSWTHRGLVIETSSANDFNAIDPNLTVDAAGQWWLTLGSFWTGIKMIQIDPATGLRLASNQTIYSTARRTTNSGSVEASFIYRHGGYYYLFVSFDFCCQGTASTYRTMVGRSTSITGPYYDRAGVNMYNGGATEILATHGSVYGPGHPAVIPDVDGDLLIYHYYTSAAPNGNLGVNLLGWDSSAWPYVY